MFQEPSLKTAIGDGPLRYTDSDVSGFGLCELLPKRTWVAGDSYVHPTWHLRRKKARSRKPWQAAGMERQWREKKLLSDLDAKNNHDLGLDDLDRKRIDDLKKLDDLKLFQFNAPALPDEIATDKVYNYATFHGSLPVRNASDPHVVYKRPQYADRMPLPISSSSRKLPVTIKALSVDGQLTAFVTCLANPKRDRTSEKVFKLLEDSLATCGTLLPQGSYQIIPPDGKDTAKIYRNPAVPKSAQSKPAPQKTVKSKREKAVNEKAPRTTQVSPRSQRKATPESRSTSKAKTSTMTVPDTAWFGDPSEPLELSRDLLRIAELPAEKRNRAAGKIQRSAASSVKEIVILKKWWTLSKKQWKTKRHRNLLRRYLDVTASRRCGSALLEQQPGLRSETDMDCSSASTENSETPNPVPSKPKSGYLPEALKNIPAARLVPRTAFQSTISAESKQSLQGFQRSKGPSAALPRILLTNSKKAIARVVLEEDPDWVDETGYDDMVFDPMQDKEKSRAFVLKEVSSTANAVFPVKSTEFPMGAKDIAALSDSFKRLGLYTVTQPPTNTASLEFEGAISGAIHNELSSGAYIRHSRKESKAKLFESSPTGNPGTTRTACVMGRQTVIPNKKRRNGQICTVLTRSPCKEHPELPIAVDSLPMEADAAPTPEFECSQRAEKIRVAAQNEALIFRLLGRSPTLQSCPRVQCSKS